MTGGIALTSGSTATSPASVAFLFGALGFVLLVAEVALPTHGIIGLLGAASILAGVGACFWINVWLGLGVLLAVVALTPVAWSLFVIIWPTTRMGKRMVLTTAETTAAKSVPVLVGQVGTSCSELRLWGECELDGRRVEAVSEYGIIPAGKPVKVVAVTSGRAIVRMIEEPNEKA